MLCAIAFLLPVIGILNVTDLALGTMNIWTAAMFAGTVLMPAAAILSFLFAIDAWRSGAGRWLRTYALHGLDRRARHLRLPVGLGHDRLQAVELLTGPRYFAVAKPTIRPTIDPGRMISQKYGPPMRDEVCEERADHQPDSDDGRRRLRLSSNQADDQSRHHAFERGARHDCADHRSGSPDLADTSAVSPSNTPRTPPSSIANTGLLHLSS